MSRLTLVFKPDNDSVGELSVSGHAHGFAGNSSAWFNRSQLDAFATALGQHPFDPNDPPSLAGGEFAPDGSLTTVWAGLEVRPCNSTGTLVVRAVLSQPLAMTGTPLRRTASFDFLTDCASVDVFRAELVSMIEGHRADATLIGTSD
jgi:hypothetical protein